MKRVALYIRVKTSKQDTENQRGELQAVADRSGWKIVKVHEDAGISGGKGRDQRPRLDAMMKAVNAKEFDMIATWSVDRLGRSLTDLPRYCWRLMPAAAMKRFHYTPKHASWLNMVEIEIGVLRGQCLDRRIDDPKRLISEIAAWE